LLDLEFVDLVLINTDAQAQLSAAGLYESPRVEVKQRPKHLLGDEVSMNRIIEDDIASHPAKHYLMTHTTNPALNRETLKTAYVEYLNGLKQGRDSLFSVTRHQTRFYDSNAKPLNHDPDNLIPTQDLEPWFEENSCYYFFSGESFAATGARIGVNPVMHETPPLEDVDIDEWRDWHLAEAILAMKERGEI